MKAAIFRDFDQPLQLGDIAEPRPATDQLLIRVARCGICGSDLHMTREPAMTRKSRDGSCPEEWCKSGGKWPAGATAKSLVQAGHLSTAVVIADLR